MITDEQVRAAVSTYHDAYHHHPQIMADMRKALEAYEQSKWISVEDRLPCLPSEAVVSVEYIVYDNLNNQVSHDYFTSHGEWNHYQQHVTHWQPLPTGVNNDY